ncbi:hypothetical protein EJB05_56828 [Eragrostis curvula]|uniref:Uncharacterized protein n=1 Tax=Eragrostis curvula TaxID=38414 RepID=A0A5J9SG85_9POAL|nr:hypothetical protein EJB05_56828 [Eragrostis curvula]
MSERKRGFDDGAGSSQQGSAKEEATRAPGDPSVDTSLSLVQQPGGVEDGRTNAEQLQSQAAVGRAQEEERAVALQGRGRDVERRTQDLISAIHLRGTSSVNCQAGGIDGTGRGRAQVPQSQGDETLAGKDAMGITGPGIYPGNATGMGVPIPGIGAPPPPRPPTPMEAAMRQLIRREVDQFMSQPAVQQQLAAVGMQQRLGITPRPGIPPPLPQAQPLNPVANHPRGTSSVNRQADGIDGAGGWRAPMLQSQGNETLAAIRATMGMTGPVIYPVLPPGMSPPPSILPRPKRPRFVSGGDPASLLTPDFLERAATANARNSVLLPRNYASGSSKVPVTGSAEALRVQSQPRPMIGQSHGSQPAVAPPRPPSRIVERASAALAEHSLALASSGMVLATGDLQLAPPLSQPEQCPYCHVRMGTMMDQPISHCCLCKACLTLNGNAVARCAGRLG